MTEKIQLWMKMGGKLSIPKYVDPKRTCQVLALSVRGECRSSKGIYCKMFYGGRKHRTIILKKDVSLEWKQNHTLTTGGPTDLTIEVWKRKNKVSKKFLGRITWECSYLDSMDQIKGWYALGGGGKSQEQFNGKIFVKLDMPGKPKSLNKVIVENRQKNTKKPAGTKPGIVFDRMSELNIDSSVTTAHTRRSELDSDSTCDFKRKAELVASVTLNVERLLKSLKEKVGKIDHVDNEGSFKKELEHLVQGINDNIALGTKTLRDIGEDLNHVSEKELKRKMQQSNYLLERLTGVVEEFNITQTELGNKGIRISS